MLGEAQQVDVGVAVALELEATAAREGVERRVGLLLAEIAGDGRAQLIDGDLLRQSRKVCAMAGMSGETNALACSRSMGVAGRASEKAT